MLIPVNTLKDFIVPDRTLGCRHGITCNNFNRCYSCPPLSPTLERYNRENYKNCLVYCFWIEWRFKIEGNNPYFKLLNANRTLSPYSWNYGHKLESLLGGKLCCDGKCKECKTCNASYEQKRPCVNPSGMRCSLESLGVDASKLSKDVLHHNIVWYIKEKGKVFIPDYITVINALLTDSNEPKRML